MTLPPFRKVDVELPLQEEQKIIQTIHQIPGFQDRPKEEIQALIRQYVVQSREVFTNGQYQVHLHRLPQTVWLPKLIWLSICKLNKDAIHSWRELQEIKNQLVGPLHEGFELYPSEERRVDLCNQYHLFVFADAKVRMPVGFSERLTAHK